MILNRVGASIQQLFRDCGVRCTPQRYAIIEFLARSEQDATADEIFAAINQRDPRASLATVYKSLRLLAAGLVQEVAMEGHAARFEANLHRTIISCVSAAAAWRIWSGSKCPACVRARNSARARSVPIKS